MYRGVERRATERHLALKSGVIVLEQEYLRCMMWDFSPAGVGLFVLDFHKVPPVFDLIIGDLTAEFDPNFERAARRCVSEWREFNRIGASYKTAA
jgi:hypothetical protein